MKFRWMGIALWMMAVVAVVYAQQGEAALVGKQAPPFEATTTAGKAVSLKSLTGDGPVFLVFWKERCPHNGRATALFNKLHQAYGEKSRLVGVVTASGERAPGWQKQFGIEYPFIGDGHEILGAYGLKKSIVTVMVDQDGKVAKTFPGYGANELGELNQAMAKAAGVEPSKVDLTDAPSRVTYG